jgi:chromosomal replication initiator protein
MNIQQAEQVLSSRDMAEKIIDTVSNYYGISYLKVTGSTRKGEVVIARFMCQVLIRERTILSLQAIGGLFKRHHSSIINALTTFSDWHDTEPKIRADFAEVKRLLGTPIDEETLIINAS